VLEQGRPGGWVNDLGYIGRSQKAVVNLVGAGRTHRNHRAARAGVGSGCRGPATASSTAHCTGSRLPRYGSTAKGRRYCRKRLLAGDWNTEALHCPKRRLARVVFQILKTNTQPVTGLHPAAA
jgi:hypothetical protein